jgi:hypothetical protein
MRWNKSINLCFSFSRKETNTISFYNNNSFNQSICYVNLSKCFVFPHLSALKEVSDHNNDSCVLLPDHPPESSKGSLNRALSGDVSPRLSESVDEVRVQIFFFAVVQGVHVAAGDARTKSNSSVIV